MKLAGERRAIASAVLGTSFLYYLVAALLALDTGLGEILTIAMATGYGVAFLALVSGYKLSRPISLAMLAIGVARAAYGMLAGDDMTIAVLAANALAMVALLGKDDLSYIRLVGERRSIAAIVLAFYGLLWGVMGNLQGPPFAAMFYALASCYAAAFFSLVAGYFWARWFAVGLLLFGVIQAVLGLWQMGPEPVVVFMGVTHGLALLALWGASMVVPYDGQTAWRERFHMDDSAVQRLGRSVIRAGVSLPMVLMYAFAPKPESDLLAGTTVVLAVAGLAGVIRLRVWGLVAMATSGTLLLAIAGEHGVAGGELDMVPLLGGGMLIAAVAPFARAVISHLRAPASDTLAA
jgi:hypothetical protein